MVRLPYASNPPTTSPSVTSTLMLITSPRGRRGRITITVGSGTCTRYCEGRAGGGWANGDGDGICWLYVGRGPAGGGVCGEGGRASGLWPGC